MTRPLLGPSEKAELETMMRDCLRAHFQQHGGAGLLAPGLHLVVTASGVRLESGPNSRCLAQVEIRQLFTAVCYLAADPGASGALAGDVALPEDALQSLATEATSATAAQINRLG